MKKVITLFLIAVAFISCGEDVKFSNQAIFQGNKDNVFWEGGNAKATLIGGNKLKMQAFTLTEEMVLEIPVPPTTINPKVQNTFAKYVLGINNVITAKYYLTSGEVTSEYKTGISGDAGEIIVSEYTGSVISGTFRFNAKNTDPSAEPNDFVNLQNGVFYRIPVVLE